MAEKVSVGIDDLRKLRELLKLDRILGEDWKRAMEQVRTDAAERFRSRIPVASGPRVYGRKGDKGPAVATIKAAMQARPVPMWARVKFDAKVVNGFRVMGALEGGSRYHYSRGGGQTKGWWSTAIRESHARAQALLSGTTSKIEARFSAWRGVIWLGRH